jgi:hypothetical protein
MEVRREGGAVRHGAIDDFVGSQDTGCLTLAIQCDVDQNLKHLIGGKAPRHNGRTKAHARGMDQIIVAQASGPPARARAG